ncbi:uncharacterized protein EI97DRAFT_472219 [Westerdykella ornata]|uniref:Prolyl 4-hydroxylase alpha subunit domain-containing protein n=1 Tax=Westerdykella ornata TaxID=318751 RepID=A0A6A6JWN2_WESOR|nr:uncharacterized protein EI97DRAFT_472219 [Westerdykella ornata]KAF2281021.1 hypothetical protein EI97DRAFT_472219 [Westerdykella ornata]
MTDRGSMSIGALIQYTLFAAVAYILAGAPYLDVLLTTFHFSSSDSARNAGNSSRTSESKSVTLDSLWIPPEDLVCDGEHGHGYRTYVFSREPLVIYVEGFLSEWERGEIMRMSNPHWAPSPIWTNNQEHHNPKIRNSLRAPLNLTKITASSSSSSSSSSHPSTTPPPSESKLLPCLAHRALSFQGHRPHLSIETPLWTQKYLPGGHYAYHYDFSDPGGGSGTARNTKKRGRASTFMVYVAAERDEHGRGLSGGGTNFPYLARPGGREWCRFVECPVEGEEEGGEEEVGRDVNGEVVRGTTFKAIPGNAVYWENLREEDGSAYRETWHAGLPVRAGVKVGLNIWSWLEEV